MAGDSSTFKAIDSRRRNLAPTKVDKRQRQIEQGIEHCLVAFKTADRTRPAEVRGKTGRLREKIEALPDQVRRVDALRDRLEGQRYQQLPQPIRMLGR